MLFSTLQKITLNFYTNFRFQFIFVITLFSINHINTPISFINNILIHVQLLLLKNNSYESVVSVVTHLF